MKHIIKALLDIRDDFSEKNVNKDIILDIDTILSLLSDPNSDTLLQPIDAIINRVLFVLNKNAHIIDSTDMTIGSLQDIMKIKNIIDVIGQNIETLTITDVARIRALRIIFEGVFDDK